MPTFFQADEDVAKLVQGVMEQFHPDLIDVKTQVSCIMACATVDEKTGDPKGPAVTHNGYPAAAVIRVVPMKQRVQGMADVEITLDGDHWEKWTKEQKVALIDHELEHLELRRDAEGHVKMDDYNRPLFRLKKHDWQIGGFDSIVKRHGDNAVEMLTIRDMLDDARPVRQLVFNFG